MISKTGAARTGFAALALAAALAATAGPATADIPLTPATPESVSLDNTAGPATGSGGTGIDNLLGIPLLTGSALAQSSGAPDISQYLVQFLNSGSGQLTVPFLSGSFQGYCLLDSLSGNPWCVRK
ncbi:hypothetical protein JMUB6875_63780 [Nocardia sp. JMUB6875]|uniref:hypothetical protein n=1 Tax=Nocardia sp. JMUB6875 TaxID=3158170 RepID=UPI0032E7C462